MPLREILFSFQGRLRRRDWWLWSILLSLFQILVTRLTEIRLLGAHYRPDGDWFRWLDEVLAGQGAVGIELAVALVFLWPALALTVKRAQDRGNRGWALIAIQLLSVVGYLLPADVYATAGRAIDASDYVGGAAAMIYGITIFIGSLYQLVVLGFLDGTLGPNRFGPSPKGIGGKTADVFS